MTGRSGEQSPAAEPDVVRVPGWESFGWLRAAFSTRLGGVSEVYGGRTLNLGWTREDDPELVRQNRERFAREVAGRDARLVGLRQVHSDVVWAVGCGRDGGLRAEGSDGELTAADGKPLLEGDGLMTNVPGVLLGVGVADCVPVLVADFRNKAVAAFHAGWRGTLAGIVEQGIARMRLRYGSKPEDVMAAIGPAIGPCCYAVGQELRLKFEAQFPYGRDLFVMGPQVHLDLWEANRRQLLSAGVREPNIWVARECTACTRGGERLRYFSHRGDSGVAGRGLGAVGVFDR